VRCCVNEKCNSFFMRDIKSSSKLVVLKLYKHAEPLRSFPSFCRTALLPNQQKVKKCYWNLMTFVEPLKRLLRTQFKNHWSKHSRIKVLLRCVHRVLTFDIFFVWLAHSSCFFRPLTDFFNDRKKLSQFGHNVRKVTLVTTVTVSFNTTVLPDKWPKCLSRKN